MKYKRYSNYKDSGIEWLMEIPYEWTITRLGNLGRLSASGIDKKVKDGEAVVSIINFTDVHKAKNHKLDSTVTFMKVTAPLNKILEHQVKIGDLIFTPSSETIEDIGISALVDEELIRTSFSYHVLRFSFSKDVNHSFKKYLTNNSLSLSQFSMKARGTTRQTLGRDDFKTINIFLPPFKEQEVIGKYLDKATGKIDALISRQEKLIDLLKEKRQAMITQAVTKGITIGVKMKNSGVDLLGETPEHWGLTPIRYLGRLQNGISNGADYFGTGFPFVNYGDVYNNVELPRTANGLAKSTIQDQTLYSVKSGDVFFTRTSETVDDIGIASTCTSTIEKAVFSGFIIRFRPIKNILHPPFSKYYFRSSFLGTFFYKEMNIVTRASLGQDLLKKLPVLLPPLKEQQQIASYLDQTTSNIDALISKSKRSIELLKEKRTTLISAAVTGKIDVREAA